MQANEVRVRRGRSSGGGPLSVRPESERAERDLEDCRHDLSRLRCLELEDSRDPRSPGGRERQSTKQQACSPQTFAPATLR